MRLVAVECAGAASLASSGKKPLLLEKRERRTSGGVTVARSAEVTQAPVEKLLHTVLLTAQTSV